MSNDDLFAEESKLTEEIQLIKSLQAKMPSKIFVGKLKLSDDRHQKVIEEIECACKLAETIKSSQSLPPPTAPH